MISLIDDKFKSHDAELDALELSLNLAKLNGPSLKELLNSDEKKKKLSLDQPKLDSCRNECQTNDNIDKSAWTISAGLLAAGMDKLISLGYISPEAAILAGVSIGAVLLSKELYKMFKKTLAK